MKTLLAFAFVHVLGLAVLQSNPEEEGVHIVLPKVTHSGTATTKQHRQSVEEHVAILAFKAGDLASPPPAGWSSQPLTPVSGWSYIELQGEKIALHTDIGSAVTALSKQRARVPAGLPSLKNSCPQMQNLRSEYLWPHSAAVASVTIRQGTLVACTAGQGGRIDTRITAPNSGRFRLSTTGKSITLKNNALVIVGSVPRPWLQSPAGSYVPAGPPHSDTYFAMGESGGGGCQLEEITGLPPCPADTPVGNRARASSGPPLPQPMQEMLSYECSNTQWP